MFRRSGYGLLVAAFAFFASYGIGGWLMPPEPPRSAASPGPVKVETPPAPVTPPVVPLSKDAAREAARQAARQQLRDEYKAKRRAPFADLAFYVDPTKLKDSRWTFPDVPPPADPDQGLMFVADFPSGNATDPTSSIHVVVTACIQTNLAKRVDYSREFKSWGRSVKMSQVELLAQGHYEDWIREATDVLKDKCKPPGKKAIGPVNYWGCAVGTDMALRKRVRKDWYVWTASCVNGTYTYVAEATTSEKFIDVPEWRDKLSDLMKGIRELTDKRAK